MGSAGDQSHSDTFEIREGGEILTRIRTVDAH
jgi:hypothetical protein